MAHTISERKLKLFLFLAEQEELRRTEPKRRRAAIEAKLAVAVFNVRARADFPVLFWPTFRAAALAGRPFLKVMCASCEQVAYLDLREIDYHPDATINCLTPYLKCLWCQPNPPLPRLIGLRKGKL